MTYTRPRSIKNINMLSNMTDKKALFVISRVSGAEALVARIKSLDVEHIYLCPLEAACVDLCRAAADILSGAGPYRVEIVDFVERFNRESFDLRKDYLAFVHETSEAKLGAAKDLKSYFVYPKKDFSLWWFSLIAEKNPYKSDTFTVFCQVLSVLRLAKAAGCAALYLDDRSGKVNRILIDSFPDRVVVRGGARADVLGLEEAKIILIEFLRASRFLLSLLAKIIKSRIYGRNPKKNAGLVAGCQAALVTAFPFLDKKALEKGEFINTYYADLQAPLEEKYRAKMTWVGMFAPVQGCTWDQAFSFARRLDRCEKLYLLEEWLDGRDFFALIADHWRVAVKFFAALKFYPRLFMFNDRLCRERVNFWRLFRKDFFSSFFGKVLVWEMSDYRAFSNITSRLPAQAKIVYFAEFQGWEKALNIACAKRPDISCVGLQHTIVPLMFLNYFDDSRVFGQKDYLRYCPRPDYLGCVGDVTKDIFMNHDWPAERLFVCGGFRFRELLKADARLPRAKEKYIVVPFCNYYPENKEMFTLLYDTFNHTDLGVRFLLKSHPTCPVERIAADLKISLNPDVFEFTKKSLSEIVPGSSAMIVKGSSSLFWAMQNGVPVIIPLLYGIIDMCSISGVNNELAVYVRDRQSLYAAVKAILEGTYVFDRAKGDRFLEKYLHIYADKNKYCENLPGCGK